MKDFREEYDFLPEEVKMVWDSYDENKDGYEECKRILEECNKIGWTFEYGLAAIPYDFRKIRFLD